MQGIDLHTRNSDAHQMITADYDRLDQVLSNLISNALQYTPAGGTLMIETSTSQNAERPVKIMVKDSGHGIPPEDLPFIFDRFWRGDKSRRERTHSGLGLAIARQLIQAHRGLIEVHSELGKGTTFIIELPDHLNSQAG